ncbi:MAG: MarR family EPS-associated transcriptional regulator [Burkholderiales bacterium]|jgi:EPS-associated MarR family transcriptional regulator|nr:MarR family EPS-associated transcriptional regulator [Burkholderiales bacterium]
MAKSAPEPPIHGQQLDLMRLLSDQPAASQREISQRLGLSLGKANYLVRALLDKGLVKAHNFRRSDNKMAYAYLLTPRGVAERIRLTRAFLARKKLEFELLKTEIQSLQSQVEADRKSSAYNKRQG